MSERSLDLRRRDDKQRSAEGHGTPGKSTLAQGIPQVVQAKSTVAAAPVVDPDRLFTGGGARLDAAVEAGMGAHFGSDFSHVRVHSGSDADALCAGAGARALTSGSDIYFRSGAYEPGSDSGRELIGHELAHVVQQQHGRADGLAAKAEDGSQRSHLESEADRQGAAAAAAMAAPLDWNLVDMHAFEAELKRRESTGEPVPLARTTAEARELPLARQIARTFLKGATPARAASPVIAGPIQAKRDWNTDPIFGGTYNVVEVSGVAGKKFLQHDPGSTAKYDLGAHLGAETSGANSRRDGNFGVELRGTGTIRYNWDSFKKADWSHVSQMLVGGAGTKTLHMHNWAFSNIEAEEDFDVVQGVISAAPGGFAGDVHDVNQKLPIVLTGDGIQQNIVFSEVFKNTSGWTAGQEIADSTTLTRSMSFGLSAKLEKKDVYKVGSELGLSSTNVDTVWSKVSASGGTTEASATANSGGTTVSGVKGKTVRKYVYPVYTVKNFKVKAYPHNDKTAEVTGDPTTFTVSHLALAKVVAIDANNEDGAIDAQNRPDAGQNAEEDRLKKEKAGKEVEEKDGVKLKVALESEKDAQQDYDKQDFSQVLTEGESTRLVTKEWNNEVTHQFNMTTAGGKKVSGTGGWSLASSGEYLGIGAKLGYSELEQSAGEFGDQVVETGSAGKTVSVKVSQQVTGPAKGSNKNVQVITMPLFRERVYTYSACDPADGKWVGLPVKARSRYYYPVGSVTTQEIPPRGELKPTGPAVLDDSTSGETAKTAKDLRSRIDAETDPLKKAELQQQLEETLRKNREALEDVVRRAHPSLEIIDRDKNLYEIELIVPVSEKDKAAGRLTSTTHKYRSTLEGLLDFTPPSTAAHDAANAMEVKDTNASDDVTITATPALGGTGAQGRANPYPGDVDMSESIRIVAPTADAASRELARAIQVMVTSATKPRDDGKLGYSFFGAMVGRYPDDAVKPGGALRWTGQQVLAGEMEYKKSPSHGGGTGRITLAQALADPAAGRAANTYWRGPIDAMGTYGEITKVLNYEAVTATGDKLFGSPTVGQSFQEVGFEGEGRHDTERAKLLEALGPQIAKYAKDGDWVKALKRAYTVARMLNDVAALNSFTPLMGSDVSQLKQAADHVEIFANDIVNPKHDKNLKDGVGFTISQEQAMAEAETLAARLAGIDGAKETVPHIHKAIAAAHGDIRRNAASYQELENHVVEPLQKKIKGDTRFAKDAEAALVAHGYLKGH